VFSVVKLFLPQSFKEFSQSFTEKYENNLKQQNNGKHQK